MGGTTEGGGDRYSESEAGFDQEKRKGGPLRKDIEIGERKEKKQYYHYGTRKRDKERQRKNSKLAQV